MLLYMQYFTGTVQYVQCSTVRTGTVLSVQYCTYSTYLQYSTVLTVQYGRYVLVALKYIHNTSTSSHVNAGAVGMVLYSYCSKYSIF